ncbi:MAG: hypothetical protein KDJ52_07295 [Anaerolineae bacterium]|nr:hypothetical protein [Anaerolineae bacterium]
MLNKDSSLIVHINPKTGSQRLNILFLAAILVLMLISYGWRIALLNEAYNYDEGIHLIWGKLWTAGYTPYEEIFVSYPPFFLWSLGLPWQIFHQAEALQLVMATYALTGVLAVIYLGTAYGNRLAGLAAGIFLSFTPAYFIPSIDVMGEVPSVGLAVVAVALAEKYRRSGGRLWLVLSGGVLALSLSLKILPFYAVPFVALVVATRHVDFDGARSRLHANYRTLLVDLIILGSSFIIVFILPIFLFDLPAFLQQVIGMRVVSRETDLNPYDSPSRTIIEFLFSNAGLITLSLYALVFVIARDLRTYGLLLAWLLFTWISMNFHVPLRGKHLPIFLPVLAVYSGLAVAHIINFLKQLRTEAKSPRTAAMVVIILAALAICGWDISNAVARNNALAATAELTEEEAADNQDNAERPIAIDFIQHISTPDDCVIADNPVFLYRTNRLPPPELGEVSQTRVDTGHLALPDLIQAIQSYDCQVVAVVSPRFAQIPGLMDWLADHYLGLQAQSETFVYFGKKEPLNTMASATDAPFGPLRLRGLTLSDQPWNSAGDNFITLFWQLEAPLPERPVVTLTLLDSTTGEPLYQTTHPFFAGLFDPARWQVNEQVRDTFRVDLPAAIRPGTVDLALSVCSAETESCLPLDQTTEDTLLVVGQIEIVGSPQ